MTQSYFVVIRRKNINFEQQPITLNHMYIASNADFGSKVPIMHMT